VEEPQEILESDAFGHEETKATKRYCIARSVVANFDPVSMRIAGPAWLSLDRGWLVGSPPKVGKPAKYEFQISAWNANGAESVSLVVRACTDFCV
jgi:hypothetical protein